MRDVRVCVYACNVVLHAERDISYSVYLNSSPITFLYTYMIFYIHTTQRYTPHYRGQIWYIMPKYIVNINAIAFDVAFAQKFRCAK